MNKIIWRKIPVFISSTFRDMDAERDTLKLNVRRRLNERYKSHHIEFLFIDLRLGVNTEGVSEVEAEDKVLDVCFESIERSRPFFIGLLGDRYGWVPSNERWEHIMSRLNNERRILIANGKGCSVTELEILFGAIGNNGENISHSLFYFRTSDSYDNVDECHIADFQDTGQQKEKLDKLKDKIQSLGNKIIGEGYVKEYTLQWNREESRFDGIDKFEDMVYNHICQEMDSELQQLKPLKLIDIEELNNDYLLHTLSCGKPQTEVLDNILSKTRDCSQMLLSGQNGVGKSTLLSQIHAHLAENGNNVCLTAFAGSTHISQTINGVLAFWISELDKHLDKSDIDINADTDYATNCNVLQQRIKEISSKGKHVVVLLDDIDYFANTDPDGLYLTWLNDEVSFVGVTTPAFEQKCMQFHHRLNVIHVGSLQPHDTKAIIRYLEEKHNMSLPKSAIACLLEDKASPLAITLLALLVSNFTAEDIKKIRQSEKATEIDKINDYIYNIVSSAPKDDALLPEYVISVLSEQLQAEGIIEALRYIAISEIGLDNDMLASLLKGNFDTLSFKNICYLLCDFILENPINHRWYFRNRSFADSLLPKDKLPYYSNLYLLASSLDREEELTAKMLPYYAIKAHISREQLLVDLHTPQESHDIYEHCINLIVRDAEFVNDAIATCGEMTRAHCIHMLDSIKNSMDNIFFAPIIIAVADRVLTNVAPEGLDIDTAYDLAQICIQAQLLLKNGQMLHPSLSLIEHNSSYYLTYAIQGLEYCYHKNPEYLDTRNMLKAMMIQDMDRIMASGDWEKINSYFETIQNL